MSLQGRSMASRKVESGTKKTQKNNNPELVNHKLEASAVHMPEGRWLSLSACGPLRSARCPLWARGWGRNVWENILVEMTLKQPSGVSQGING